MWHKTWYFQSRIRFGFRHGQTIRGLLTADSRDPSEPNRGLGEVELALIGAPLLVLFFEALRPGGAGGGDGSVAAVELREKANHRSRVERAKELVRTSKP
ncbi:unnamed protein product [Sphagnum troendelagicum]